MLSIKEKPPCDRPRERLLLKGPQALADIDLVAMIIGSGTPGRSLYAIASDVIRLVDGQLQVFSLESLQKIQGIGLAQATRLVAAQEFFKRRNKGYTRQIMQPSDILPVVSYLAQKAQEHFCCLSLNGAGELIQCRVVSVGMRHMTQIHPREVFTDPITDRASAIIVAHNHTESGLEPSQADKDITKVLIEAGEILGVPLVDHIIFNQNGYFSFKEAGIINE
jgi:DNA repair protein RadC